ncbi:MAG: TIGR03435 family protein [Vicinamibacterales bacterium]
MYVVRKLPRRSGNLPAIALLAMLPLLETASAQTATQPPGAALTFEVASVRRQAAPAGVGASFRDSFEGIPSRTFRGNRFLARNATAAWLIREAYGNRYRLREQVLGGPEWIDQDRFEIEAVTPAVGPSAIQAAAPVAVLEMLRSLLETRFRLRVREEMREGPVYALVRARGDGRLGVGLKVSGEDCTELGVEKNGERAARPECIPQYGGDRYRRVGHPMERFVQSLERRVGRLVINETGLSGTVDLDLPVSVASNFTDLARIGADSGLFIALTDVLGLKLESRRAPIPVLVVERIERPAEN